EPRAGLLDDRQHLQRTDEPIAGGRLIQAQDMARSLAAKSSAGLVEHCEHVTIADLRAYKIDASLCKRVLESQVLMTVPTTGPRSSPAAWRATARMNSI